MLFDLISNPSRETLIMILLSIPIILFALSAHESAHGLAASLLGDNTARNLGRITLNPAKHLDFFGTLMMFTVGFGWAKPVPVVSRNFRKPKWGMALTAIAGPLSNLLFSYVFFVIHSAIGSYFTQAVISNTFVYAIYLFFYVAFLLNLSLAVFNLLPVPPLDGSRILFVLLPSKAYFAVMKYERYISIAIMVLLFSGALTIPLNLLCDLITEVFSYSVRWMG